jgi:hypothetical protein
MQMNLRQPCSNCPFRKDIPAYLSKERAEEIVISLMEEDKTFSCHKTNDFDDETGDTVETKNSEHCGGALVFLEKQECPNQWMRVAERFGWYDRSKLKMDAPVFDTPEEFITAQP